MSDKCEHDWCPGRDLEWEKQMLEEYGFFSHMVPFEGPDNMVLGMDNFHTHGLPQSVNHPDIQCTIRLHPQTWGSIIHIVYDMIKDGKKFEPGKEYQGFLANDMPVAFAWAEEAGRDVLRMVLPDEDGKVLKDEIDDKYSAQWLGTFDEPLNGVLEIEIW